MHIEELYHIYKAFPSVQTDTRKLQPGDIYFALKGANFNGNLFARQAIEAGAAYAVIDEEAYALQEKTILVENVLTTLQALARYHREQLSIPFIAITGSNGKTTTKELIHAVLSSGYSTSTTIGNLNNHIGIPLTLLKVKEDDQIAVIEMGANHQKEIESYCVYTQPTHGLITNAGKAHLEGFGGVEGVKKGKGELFDYLRSHNGTAFVMWDYAYLRNMSKGIPSVITYGTKDSTITGTLLKSEPFTEVHINASKEVPPFTIQTKLVGAYNLPNILAAVAVGLYFTIPAEKIKAAIENYTPSNSRSQLVEQDTNTIILDAYNANPSSMKLAIENFAALPADKKVLLLGAMAELGEESLREHEAIIHLIEQYNWRQVALVGGDFLKIAHRFLSFENVTAAKAWWQSQQHTHTHILIKGSRSMEMEKIVTV